MAWPKADIVLRGGPVWCGRGDGVAQAAALWNGVVLATGSAAEIEPLIGPATRVIELNGRLATPGLNDSHLHLISLGLTMAWVDGKPQAAPTLESLLAAIRARADKLGPGKWVLARGYDQTKLDVRRHPLRGELDKAAPRNPVLLVRACGHIAICNSEALRLGGIDESSVAPKGGLIEKKNGRLTGLLAETARRPVYDALPAPTRAELIDGIEMAGRYLNSFGITSCMDAAVGQKSGFEEIAAYNDAKRAGRLKVRTWLCLLGDPSRSIVPQCLKAGLVSGVGDDLLKVGAVKIFLDGSAGGRTAWMSKPYLGADETCGVPILRDNELNDIVLDYHAKGYQLACHAIGDAAIGQLISAYENALSSMPAPDRRHRVEHCGYSTSEHHRRMKKAGIYPCPQQVFVYDFGDAYLSVLGEERGLRSYPFKTWIDLGFRPATGSDAPVCDPSPFPNLYAMLTRKTWKGTLMDASERAGIQEALEAYTESGAFSQKEEARKGRLVPGQLADVAVFSRNLLTATPEEILHDTRADLTILGGKVVYDRHGQAR
ncbi:MAG: amidohydrolase [Hyphomicrobiaceae bacterium]|nr:MAG: amidohydrolase [Hyphomicrobiaceae bacterium]